MSGTIKNFEFETNGMLVRFEGEFQIITCKMRRTKSDTCNNVFSGLKNKTKLFTHHGDNRKEVNDHEINKSNQTTIMVNLC